MDELPVETTIYSLSDDAPRMRERRESERHLTLFRVGSMIVDGRRELCLIKNISAGGMLIRAYSTLAHGTAVTVELKRGEAIAGRVGWIKDDCAGISFDSPIDVLAMLAVSMDGPRPRMPRIEVRAYISVSQDGHSHGMRTCDISQGGVKVETARPLKLGGAVTVSLSGVGTFPGVVRWRDGDCFGITFNRLLAIPDLVRWLNDQREQLRATG